MPSSVGACLPALLSAQLVSSGQSRTAGALVDQPAPWPGGYSCFPGPLPSPVAGEPEWWGLESTGQGGDGEVLLAQEGPSPSPGPGRLQSRPHLAAGLAAEMLNGQVQGCLPFLPARLLPLWLCCWWGMAGEGFGSSEF